MKQYTFWRLINEYEIEIPVIQRDYAQGRLSDKINEIREKLVLNLITVLGSGSSYHLDFVYGKTISKTDFGEYERQKDNVSHLLNTVREFAVKVNFDFKYQILDLQKDTGINKVLIPLDGQQRLTTLWLLHFYIGSYLGMDISRLKGFSYKTRKSSRDFCIGLIEHAGEFKVVKDDISSSITDKEWFFSYWKDDPTVAGMLVMLSKIQKVIIGLPLDLKSAWLKLTETSCLSFDFFDLDKFNLQDELYVKMNARGKPLSDYENFKAWLQDEVVTQEILVPEEFWHKLDKQWLDIFWKLGGADSDRLILQFFKNMALFKIMESFGEGKLSSTERMLIKKLEGHDYVSSSFYKAYDVFNKSSLDFIFNVLDLLKNGDDNILSQLISKYWTNNFSTYSFSNALLNSFSELNLFDKTFLYAVLRFLFLKKKTLNEFNEADQINFENYLRTMRNLIYNIRIDDVSPYVDAVKAICNLGDHVLNLSDYLSTTVENDKKKWISFFRQHQQEEEWLKNKLSVDPAWLELFKEAEDHHYFYGQIGFILEAAKSDDQEHNQLFFRDYYEKLKLLFTEDNLDNPKFLIQRALLCFGDYLLDVGSDRWNFCSQRRNNSRERDENWRSVFNVKEKWEILKKLLDRLPEESLIDIINSYEPEHKDWRYFFIKDSLLISVCGQKLIKFEQDGNFIRLLGQSRLSHFHRELRTFVFFRRYKEKYKVSLDYRQSKTKDDVPSLQYTDGINTSIIKFDAATKGFVYFNETGNNDELYRPIDEDCPLVDELKDFETYCS